MERKPLYYLLASLACIVMLIMLVGGGGLNANTKALLEAELAAYPRAVATLQQEREFVAKAVTENRELFSRQAASWQSHLEEQQRELKAVAPALESARSLADERGDDARASIEEKLLHVRATQTAALTSAEKIHARIEKLLALRENQEELLKQAAAEHQALRGRDVAALQAKVKRAARDWPAKRGDLEQRLSQLEAIRREGEEAWQVLAEQRGQPQAAIDYAAMADAAELLHQGLIDFSQSQDHLAGLVDQLYISWERVLIDMAVEEGQEVRFLHKLQTTRIRVPGSAESEISEPLPPVEEWLPVNRDLYEKHKNDLGMALAVKPAGKYDDEAETGAAEPPGYAYIASPEEGANQYGHWVRNREGGSFWEFYGKYAFFQSLFWGPSYRPIYMNDYRSYRRYRDSGRPYYGDLGGQGQPRYGSRSTSTRKRYGSSRYVRSDGFRGSRYEQSGGKFRGSKYETPASRSRSRATMPGRSSRRSGGYRSSPRRSSRSRGGK
jgi:hypothetical protein